MLELMESGAYSRAAAIADEIDWRRVRNAVMLSNVSEIYEKTGEYQKGYDILTLAYQRAEGSRKIISRLCGLALKTGNVDEAIDFYDEFMQIAPKDPNQYILRYKILRAQRAPIEQQIEALEEYKKSEYIEEWAYELAKLYQEAGMTAECLEECDDLILWFSEGKYVYQAMELKMQYKPLTPSQQEKYDRRYEKVSGETEEMPNLMEYQAAQEAATQAQGISGGNGAEAGGAGGSSGTTVGENEDTGETGAESTSQVRDDRLSADGVTEAAEEPKPAKRKIGNTMKLDEALRSLLNIHLNDGNNEDSFTTNHMKQADQLAEAIEEMQPGFLVNKVYFDAYKRSSLGTYPDVHNEIEKLLKSGQLLINYTGHGSTTHWADESVWTQTDINNSSYKHLPVWVTATCDFTRFDDVKTSAGESVFLNPTSGGIALFTTTRVVFSGNNANLNKALIDNLFQEGANSRYTLGEAMMYTKRQLNDSNKLNFILIGDPALKFAYPEYKARVTAVNGEAVSDEPFEFKALSRITVEGEILNPSGSFAADFTGVLSSTIFDSQSSITTLGNSSEKFTYLDYPNTIYIGRDSVRNGKFSFTFMVPKDISYYQ